MADTYTSDIKSAISQKTEVQELGAAWLNVADIQKKITDSYNEEVNVLQKMVGVEGLLKKNVIDRFKDEMTLKSKLKNLESQITTLKEKSHSIVDAATRDEAKLSLEGMLQRKLAWEKEAEMLNKINRTGLGVFLFFLSNAVSLFKKLDSEAWEFRKAVGMSRDQSEHLKDIVQGVSIEYTHIGVTAKNVNSAIISAGQAMGSMHNVTRKVASTISILEAQLGVAAEDTTTILRNFAVMSGTTMETQNNMVYFAQALSAAGGVSFTQIAKDFRSMKDTTFLMVSRLPSVMAKTAVELRRMGTDINSAASSSRKLLDFTQNVQDEMEASVLLGHSINLQKARELAYNRDIEGSTKEILRLAKQSNFAHGMDTFQMEAFAKATGRSVEDLLSMVQASEEMDKALSSSDPKIKTMAQEYQRLKNANEAAAQAAGKNVEYQLMLKANQERLTAISQKWEQMLARVSQWFLPIIDGALSFVDAIMPAVPLLMGMTSFFEKIGEIISNKVTLSLMNAVRYGEKLSFIAKVFTSVQKAFSWIGSIAKVGGFIGSWAPLVFKFVAPFFKLLGPIGWIITAFQAISGFVRGFKEGGLLGGLKGAFTSIIPFGDKIWDFISKLWNAIGPIGQAIIKWTNPLYLVYRAVQAIINVIPKIGAVIKETFSNAWNGIKDWLGFSPSNLGLRIVKGILSIQTMLFDAITYPWRHAFAWIADKLPGMGKIAEKLRGGFGGMTNSIESKVTQQQIQPTQIAEKPAQVTTPTQAPAQAQTAEAQATTQDNGKLLASILESINILNKNLESGKIGFYVDGQLLSATIARQTEFRGGYGVNKV
jgi:hypothetical protein